MNEYEKMVPLEARNAVDAFIDVARANMEKDGVVLPVAFVGKFDGGGTVIGGLEQAPKEYTPLIVRKAAKENGADFVLFVTEAWLKALDFTDGKAAREYYERRDREGGAQVRDMPGRIDAVMFQMETYAGSFLANVPREGVEGAYTFGKPEFKLTREQYGVFTGMLPPRGPKQ